MFTKIRDLAVSFIICGVLFTAATYILLFDSLPPKKLFSLPLLVILPFCLFLVISFFVWLLARSSSSNKNKRNVLASPLDKQKRSRFIKLYILFLVIIAIGTLIYIAVYNHNYAKYLAKANEDFVVQQIGSIPKRQAESIVIDLENGVSLVRSEYGIESNNNKELVFLFPNAKAMQAYVGEDAKIGGSVTIEDGQIYIFLPVEQAMNAMQNNDQSSTPLHEATHVVFAEILGEKMFDLPLWFLEGTAQYEQFKGSKSFPDRIIIRYYLWHKNVPVMPDSVLLSNNVSQSDYESDSFYLTSYELTRYMAQQYGKGSFVQMVKLFSNGLSFDAAFQKVYGMSQEQAYQDWYQGFF